MLDETLARLPEGASVSAHFFLGDHLARRERLFLFPDHREDADLLVYDLALPFTRLMTRRTVQHRAELPINTPFLEALRDPRYGVTLYRDGLVLLRKGADHEAGLALLLDAPSWEIDQRALRPVGDGLWCAGSTYRGRAGLSRGWAHLTLYWTAPEGLGKETELLLRCVGPTGETQIRHVPLLGLLPARRWTPGRIFRDEVFIPLPPGPPRGTYWVRGGLTGGAASGGGDVGLASFELR